MSFNASFRRLKPWRISSIDDALRSFTPTPTKMALRGDSTGFCRTREAACATLSPGLAMLWKGLWLKGLRVKLLSPTTRTGCLGREFALDLSIVGLRKVGPVSRYGIETLDALVRALNSICVCVCT